MGTAMDFLRKTARVKSVVSKIYYKFQNMVHFDFLLKFEYTLGKYFCVQWMRIWNRIDVYIPGIF